MQSSPVQITALTCEYLTNPLGIDIQQPRLSWKLTSARPGAKQIAYQIRAASTQDGLSKADLWDTGKVDSDQSVYVVYAGRRLESRQRVYWNVTIWDETGGATTSGSACFEMGLLKRRDWKAKWIGAVLVGGPRSTIPAPYLRKPFRLRGPISAARLYVTALGLYECSINGQTVGEDVFAPGWTDYKKRVQYKVYDVTSLLHDGDNMLGAILGDGWAVGHISWNHRQAFADRPQLFAQLEVKMADGGTLTVATDRTWMHQVGPLMESDMLMGEAYDARREMRGWDQSGFDDKRWLRVEVFDDPGMAIIATNGPMVRRIEELKPISDPVDKSNFQSKRYIFDMGQNMVGRVRIKGSAPAGTTITLHFAEVLAADGSLYTANLRGARVTDYYTFKGEGEEVWEPKFTFHGFRYVQLDGYPGVVTHHTITGIVLHSDMPPTGDFTCSDPTLNQLQHNIVWGQKGNFVDVPTDCPQRDERLGWTGDIQVFVRTAAFNMNVAGFMTKWAQDVADSQNEQGAIPPVVPAALANFPDGGPAWADAVIICPWTIYLCYGDKRILENNYAVMSRFMDFLIKTSPGYIRCAPEYEGWPGFSDWLSINANTPRDLIGTAFLAYDANLMAQIADALGKKNDTDKYRKLFTDVKAAFGARYLKGSQIPTTRPQPSQVRLMMDQADAISRGNLKVVDYGPVLSEVFNTDLFTPTQTAYVLALHFGLLPDKLIPIATDELVSDIERRDGHLSTGFVGSPYLPHVLSKNGRSDVAYALLNQKSWPSWLYSVTQGATTIWERWDGWTPENGFQNPEMNSFNHYAYGAIGAWLYSTVAGIEIDPEQPGYKHIIVRPQPGGGLTQARGEYESMYGKIVSDWRIDADQFTLIVTIPANTQATVYVPAADGEQAGVEAEGAAFLRNEGKWAVYSVGSGVYQFRAKTH